MVQHTTKLSIAIAVAMLGCLANAQTVITTRDLDWFTHAALIPAGSDLSSLRLERVKAVRIPTRIRSTMRTTDCEESLYCPYTTMEAPVQAYEVTYSYTGQPLISDESGGRYFTFSVYFRPEELTSRGKLSRADAERLFDVTTSRVTVPRAVIDEEQSKFCAGNYVDGAWVQADSSCKDDVRSGTVMAAADYVTVHIDAAPTRVTARK
jgi:hypothetical protein